MWTTERAISLIAIVGAVLPIVFAFIFWAFIRKAKRESRLLLVFVVTVNQLAGAGIAMLVAYTCQFLLGFLSMSCFIVLVLVAAAIACTIITTALGKFRDTAWRMVLLGNLVEAAILFPMWDTLMRLTNS